MKLLESEKLDLPQVYFVSDRSEIKDIPIGVPFIFGDANVEEALVTLLEYEVLYLGAMKTGYPFNFKKILEDAGYKSVENTYVSANYETNSLKFKGKDFDIDNYNFSALRQNSSLLKSYIRNCYTYVDISILKDLKIFPVWMTVIEDAVSANIHNFAAFDENMYNKKLEGMYGGISLVTPNKNLIIIDISSSIPRGVSATCLTLAKNLAESFYADLLITGSKSTLYPYEEIYKLNVETIYKENGTSNDQIYFKKLVSESERIYKTAIVFGDHDYPGHFYQNEFSAKGTGSNIHDEDGKKLCKWKIENLISFYVNSVENLAGYARWFTPKTEQRIADWVKYL